MNLEESLREHWPPHRIFVECGECGGELFDSKKHQPLNWQASYTATLIESFAKQHNSRTGHANIDVAIDKEPTPVREIDCHVTVNTK